MQTLLCFKSIVQIMSKSSIVKLTMDYLLFAWKRFLIEQKFRWGYCLDSWETKRARSPVQGLATGPEGSGSIASESPVY